MLMIVWNFWLRLTHNTFKTENLIYRKQDRSFETLKKKNFRVAAKIKVDRVTGTTVIQIVLAKREMDLARYSSSHLLYVIIKLSLSLLWLNVGHKL